MKITSLAFENGGFIPKKFTADGENISPPLLFEEIPSQAKSLVLIVDDPDAPAKIWVHWLVWNISPKTKSMAEAEVPEGAVVGLTDFGKAGYGGPSPPSGTHRYFFRLYGLDTSLDLDESTDRDKLEEAMKGHILDQAELMVKYSRVR